MIANESEYKMTKKAAKKLQVAHEAANRLPSAAVDPRIHAAMQDGILNQLDELHDQMSEYEDGKYEDGIRVVVRPGWETSTGVIRSQLDLHDQISEYERETASDYQMSCYLAGPMRGLPFWNQSEFEHVAECLREIGWIVFSPFEHDIEQGEVPPIDGSASQVNLAGCLEWDFARIAEADCVVVLPGWETSTGVHWEMTVAYALAKRVLQYPTMTEIELPQVVTDPVAATAQPDGSVTFTADAVLTFPDLGAEVRITDPVTGASKGSKLARFDLLPWDVLTELAEHYGRGSLKYDDRNWEKGYRWSLSSAALGRHLAAWLSGEDTDQETGSSHLVAVIWHAAALRWFQKHNRGTDDRSKAE